jgi:lipoate-protein ligase A
MAGRLVTSNVLSTCRLIIDAPADGAWNMALDEALLESAADEGVATLRLYGWSRPTLSLGYFQPHLERSSHAASLTCAVVRRSSGGGAIVHDDELTYSLALPAQHRLAVHHQSLYRLVHQALVDSLPPLPGNSLTLCSDLPRTGAKPFLCFLRRGGGDVLVDGVKFAGSAQRRMRGAILQHGSLLLGRSSHAPELPGWRELTGKPLSVSALTEAWVGRLEVQLEARWLPDTLPDGLLVRALALAKDKYATSEWTWRK